MKFLKFISPVILCLFLVACSDETKAKSEDSKDEDVNKEMTSECDDDCNDK